MPTQKEYEVVEQSELACCQNSKVRTPKMTETPQRVTFPPPCGFKVEPDFQPSDFRPHGERKPSKSTGLPTTTSVALRSIHFFLLFFVLFLLRITIFKTQPLNKN